MSINGVSGGAQMVRSFQPPTFGSLDKDSSGGITLEELTSGAPGGASDSKSAERAEKLFEAMDTDKSGAISSDEKSAFDEKIASQRSAMQFTAQLLGSGTPPSNDEVFAATDTDGDDSVSLAEFSDSEGADGVSSEALSQLFDLIDGDGDGAISKTESSSFLDGVQEAMAGGGGPGGPHGAGGPPPGGPPPGGSESEEEEDDDSTSSILDMLTAATQAYSASSQQNDLLSTLTSILDRAA